jgi:hypothetical protein
VLGQFSYEFVQFSHASHPSSIAPLLGASQPVGTTFALHILSNHKLCRHITHITEVSAFAKLFYIISCKHIFNKQSVLKTFFFQEKQLKLS